MGKEQKNSRVNLCILSFIIILVAYSPHLQSEMQLGHDDWFHFHRILSVASGLRQGIFPTKIHHLAGFGYGYGVGFFYSDFFLYIPALLMNLFNLPLDIAYRIFAFIIYAGIYASMFYCLQQLTGTKEYAFWGASVYLFSNKVLEAFYNTVGLGQMCAFVFFPMAIIGMYLFLKKDKKPILLMFGFIGLIYSHTISTFMAFVICCILVILNLKILLGDIGKMLNLFISVGVTAMVTASFWLPMLEQMKAQLLKVKAPWTASVENVLKFKDIVMEQGGLGYVVVFFLCFNAIMCVKTWIEKRKAEYQLTFVAMFIVILTMFKPFWYFMNEVLNIRFLQFPARFLAPVTVVIIADTAMRFREMNIEKLKVKFIPHIVLLSTFILSLGVFLGSYTWVSNEHINKAINNEIEAFGSGEEWLPIETDREEILDADLVFDNEGNKITGEKKKEYTRYVFTADLSKEYYDIPYIWYKGYGAVDADGNSYEISQNRTTGMVQVLMPEEKDGIATIEVYYKGTKYQKLAYFSSCVGVVSLIVYLIILKRDKDILSLVVRKIRNRNKE